MNDIAKQFSGISFLVVDDDPIGLDMIITLLKHYGASTFPANNGATGLVFARQLKPDIIISDLSMPVMNGWKMIAELKSDCTTNNIPIIALTAHAMRGDREKAMAAGCHGYLTKPIDPYNFIAQLQSILDDISESSVAPSETPVVEASTSAIDKKDVESSISDRNTTQNTNIATETSTKDVAQASKVESQPLEENKHDPNHKNQTDTHR